MSSETIDLGDGHFLSWFSWAPDRDLNPQYDGIPNVEKYGALITHPPGPKANPAHWGGKICKGAIVFESETQRRIEPQKPAWKVDCWKPLTISPSVLCSCGDHGWIRNGKWVKA